MGKGEAQWDKNSPWVLHQEIMGEIDIESTSKEQQPSIFFGNMEVNSHKTQLKEWKMVPYGVQDLGDVGREGRQSCLVICLPHYATQIKWKCCKMWFLFQVRALPSRRQYGNSFRKIRQAMFAGCYVIKIDNKKDSAQQKHNRLFKWHFWLRMKWRGWRDGSAAISTWCSFRGPEFVAT